MKPTHAPIAGLFFSLSLCVAITGQDVPVSQEGMKSVPARGTGFEAQITEIHTAEDDGGVGYGTWAAGNRYKASFHDGMTFVPYLGQEYPHNQPLSWKTESVRIGGLELVTDVPRGSHTGSRYEYDLGGVIEAYDVRVDGLEQTFTIMKRPAAVGDLVVVGRVDSLLLANSTQAGHQAIVFSDQQGEAILSYGAATAIDAAGRRAAMTSVYNDGQITLTLDADWLATAAYPLVVDPLLGNVSLRSGNKALDVDVLREDEGVSDNVWFVYSRAASNTDIDLWVWRSNDTLGGASVSAFQDITSSWTTDQGKLAASAGSDQVVTLFRRLFLSANPYKSRLRWHAHDIADLVSGTSVTGIVLGATSGTNDWRPDIGGTRGFTSGSKVCLIWQREENGSGTHFANTSDSDVYMAILDLSGGGQGVLSARTVVKADSAGDYERPTINQSAHGSATSTYGWVAAWMVWGIVASNDWDIACSYVDSSNTVSSTQDFIQPLAPIHKLGPTIEGQDGRYLVVYSTSPVASVAYKTGLITGHSIGTARVDLDASKRAVVGETNSLFTSNDRRWMPGGCGFDTETRSHWAVGYVSSVTNNTYIRRVGFTGGPLRQSTLYDGGSSNDAPGAAAISFDDDNDRFVALFSVANATASNPVVGDLLSYPARATGPTVATTSGISCGSAAISWDGPGSWLQDVQVGNEFTRVRVAGAPSGSMHFMLVSLQSANFAIPIPMVGSTCRMLVDSTGPGFIAALGTQTGTSVSWSLPIPEPTAGIDLYFQGWYANASLTKLQSTKRLLVPLTK